MFLRGHEYYIPLVIGRSPAVGHPLLSLTILQSSATQAIQTKTQSRLTRRQWMQHCRSHTAAAAEEGPPCLGESINTVSPADPKIPTGLPCVRKPLFTSDQAPHDVESKSRDQFETEIYAGQVAALLRSNSESNHEEKGPYAKVYGKNQQDKRLVNQLLKDKGRLSHDWRLPLLQLEQHYRSRDGNGAASSLVDGQSQKRKVMQQDFIRTVSSSPKGLNNARLAREVPRPSRWSQTTFSGYITDVAKSQVSQVRIPRVLKPQREGWSNHADVVKIFDDLFYDPTLKNFVSLEACNKALQYYYKHGLIAKARTLYDHMNTLRMRISTDTFNIILRGAASNKDLHTFTFLLHRMLKRGFSPDENTWLSLLIAVDSVEVRAILRHKMEQKGLLKSPHTRVAIAALMIPNELDFHVGNDHDPMTFLDHMDARYGTAWLTTRAGNYFLSEISKLRSVTESLKLLQQMKERKFAANEVTLNTLLHRCAPSRSRLDTMEVLRFCENQFGLRPGRVGYNTLFLQAWNKQQLNFARVIWRSACIDGCVTFKMRQLVFKGLLSDKPHIPPGNPNTEDLQNRGMLDLFRLLAGEFVVGIGQPQTSELAELGKASWESRSVQKAMRVRRAKLLLEIDTLVAGSCRLMLPLPELMQRALDLDHKWLAGRVYNTDNTQKLIQDGVQVEVDRHGVRLLEARKIQRAMRLPQAMEPLNKAQDV
ncbi:hypothetical protein N7G274_001968 [Stereocaulon virgatum]|uniref:Pentatricopeptide repeat-containing protein n=1 Tax=Stereocaulon virgatum TaxID=373712 RepID=A0ABR4AK38_9LECA